jgi:hypothetical protein
MPEYDESRSALENLARAVFALANVLENMPEQHGQSASCLATKYDRSPPLPREIVSADAVRVGDRLFKAGSGCNESFTVTRVEFCPHVGGGILGRDDTDGHAVSWGLGPNSTVERRI